MSAKNDTTQVVINLSKIEKSIVREIVFGAQAVQQKVVNDAREIVHVVTGNLRNSILRGAITITNDNVEAIVEAGMEYASFVEFGTRRSHAYPYMGPALIANLPVFRDAIYAAVGRAIQDGPR